MKLFFVTVPTLVDFYKSQNELAAAGARTQAQLRTQATLTREELRSREKQEKSRLAQDTQLKKYQLQMENLRAARELSSEERQVQAEALRKDMQAQLNRQGRVETTEITQQGAAERNQADIQAQAPKLQAQTEEARQKGISEQQGRPFKQAKLSAEATLASEKAKIAQSPDLQGIMNNVKQFNEDKKTLSKTLGNDGYANLLEGIKNQANALGVDLENNTDYLEATQDQRKKYVKGVESSLEGYGKEMTRTGALSNYSHAVDQIKTWEADGRITPEDAKARMANANKMAKANNIPENLIEV